MAIDFAVNDKIVVIPSYVTISLSNAATDVSRRAAIYLGNLGTGVCNVAAVGTIGSTVSPSVYSYIRLVPINVFHPSYNQGNGVVIYFDQEAELNNSLELSNAFFSDYIAKKVHNNTGSALTKNSAVYQNGFSVSAQLPTVAAASAAASATAYFIGFLEEDIANGASGTCVIGGSIIVNTAATTINDLVYLSDTAGQFSFTAGTVSKVIGRVQSVGAEGSIQFSGEVAAQGGGSGGATGIRGMTGINGATGVAGIGVTGLIGATGVQGLGQTGIQGNPGQTGIAGNTGILGLTGQTGILGLTGQTGIAGNTGILGLTGQTGIAGNTGIQGLGETGIQGNAGQTGIAGNTGIQGIGQTGIAGNTGIAITGSTGIQGTTGVGAGGSANSISVLATVSNINPLAGATRIALYSVPVSTKTIITELILRLDAANTITTTVTGAGGFNVNANDVFAPVQTTGVTATNDVWAFNSQAKMVLGVAGQTFLLGITGMVGTTGLFSADLIGYEKPA